MKFKLKHIFSLRAQATIELALMLLLIFGVIATSITVYKHGFEAKRKDIEYYNVVLKETGNMSRNWTFGGEPVGIDIVKFDIPRVNVDLGDILDETVKNVWRDFGKDILGKLGINAGDNWFESGLSSGINEYIASGFDKNEFGWGFMGGVAGSKDFGGLLTNNLTDIGGSGLQGLMTGALASHQMIEHGGDWRYAILKGFEGAFNSDTMQGALNDLWGDSGYRVDKNGNYLNGNGEVIGSMDKNGNFLDSDGNILKGDDLDSFLSNRVFEEGIFSSVTDGAIIGALNSEKGNEWNSILQGSSKGALMSSTVQNPLSSGMGDRDYATAAVNASALTAINDPSKEGILRDMWTNSAQAAFSSESIQKGLFGDKPNSAAKNVSNAAVSSGLGAIQNEDASIFYYGAAYGVGQEAVGQAIGVMYPAPDDPEKIASYYGKRSFIAGLTTTGIVMASNKEFSENYAAHMASQLAYATVGNEISKTTEKGKEKIREGIRGDDDEKKEDNKNPDTASVFLPEQLSLVKKLKDLNGNIPAVYASNDIAAQSSNIKSDASQPYSDKSILKQKINISLKEIYDRLETISPYEIIQGELYAYMLSQRHVAEKTLENELKRNLKLFNEKILERFGYIEDDINMLLETSAFEKSLDSAVAHPQIQKRIKMLVSKALSPANIVKTTVKIQQRIMNERAFTTELAYRKIIWQSTSKSTLYTRSKRKNLVIEIYERVKEKAQVN